MHGSRKRSSSMPLHKTIVLIIILTITSINSYAVKNIQIIIEEHKCKYHLRKTKVDF